MIKTDKIKLPKGVSFRDLTLEELRDVRDAFVRKVEQLSTNGRNSAEEQRKTLIKLINHLDPKSAETLTEKEYGKAISTLENGFKWSEKESTKPIYKGGEKQSRSSGKQRW